ncbi:MbtH family NRPS accessory protein [Streptomyces sp. NPDC048416]|uniref:MbtH family NRPS accessory protein n=1 Tax=Streptomyces sp. NPDC048416 TaxID=3365546 RepID=UPI003714072F
MSGNPFDAGGEADWLVVTNADRHHALWRPYLEIPKGWRIVHRDPDREAALDYVEQHVTTGTGSHRGHE